MSSYSFQGRQRIWTPRDEEENRTIFSAMPQNTGINMPKEFKPLYLENAEYAVEKWSLQQLIRLLRLYGSHRCLWDVGDPENRNRKLRKAALLDITVAMGGDLTVNQVLQKINVLRVTYRYEKRRIKKRMRKGLGASTKLKWFPLADAILRNVPRAEKWQKSTAADPVDSDSDLDDSVVFSVDPELLSPLNINTNFSEENKYSSTASSLRDESTNLSQNDQLGNLSVSEPLIKTIQQHNKRPWTSVESIRFVELLREQPTLWRNDTFNLTANHDNIPSYQHSLRQIADAMELPIDRIAKRVRTFKRAYFEEKLKVACEPSYMSPLIWFPLAETFMAESTNIQDLNFVDPNSLSPPPMLRSNAETPIIKEEQTKEEEEFLPLSPINPIPSVASPSTRAVAEAEALETLFTKQNSDIKTENCEQSVMETCSVYSYDDTTHQEMMETRSSVTCDDSVHHEATNSLSTPCKKSVKDRINSDAFPKIASNEFEDDLLEGKWSLKHSVKFLRLYGSHRCLWDLNDPDYRSRALRNAAIEDIAAAMGHGLDADYVAKKIKIFRITYMQHRKRMLHAHKASEAGPEMLRWFPLADSFLRPHIGLRSIKERDSEVPQFDFQYVYAKLNLIDPALLNDFVGNGTQNFIKIGEEERSREERI